MSNPQTEKLDCPAFASRAGLYAWGELEPAERSAVEAHARECAVCAAALEREVKLQATLATAENAADKLDPAGVLLMQCRGELDEALDDLAGPRRTPGWLRALHPENWLVRSFLLRPAWSAALLAVLGVALGAALPGWYRARTTPAVNPSAVQVLGGRRLTDQDLQTMGVAAINWVPDTGSGTPGVELRLTSEKPFLLQGSADDTDVKRVLTFVVENGQRFDAGVLLDSVDVLRTRSSDTDVRHALCQAARKDRNPGVRLRALEALRGFEQDPLVRQTLLDVLVKDANPGARIEAINALQAGVRAAADQGRALDDPALLKVLRNRMQKDTNPYIRMQSAAAVRQLGPAQKY